MESFPPSHEFDVEDELRLNIAIAEVDLVIAIERTGPNIEGRYLTMRSVCMYVCMYAYVCMYCMYSFSTLWMTCGYTEVAI